LIRIFCRELRHHNFIRKAPLHLPNFGEGIVFTVVFTGTSNPAWSKILEHLFNLTLSKFLALGWSRDKKCLAVETVRKQDHPAY
jgi:hypothetical protein